MNVPAHHVPADWLAARAAGTLDPALALVVDCHAELCAGCEAELRLLDVVGAASLLRVAPAPMSAGAFERLLARLPAEPLAVEAEPEPQEGLPRPLWPLLRGGVPWRRTMIPGASFAELPLRFGGEPVRLTRARPGLGAPHHDHRGPEAQLVLAGGYTSGGVAYGPGDLQIAEDGMPHDLVIDPGEDCVTLLVKANPLVVKGLYGRVFGWLTGL